MDGILRRRGRSAHRGGGRVNVEAEIGVMHPQAKEHQGLLGAARS